MLRRWMIGLGSNLGDSRAVLERTLGRLRNHTRLSVIRVSSLYRTAPVGAEGPDFLNAVVALDSPAEPDEMLVIAQSLEALEARARPYRNAPRTLDVDLLLAGSLVIASPQLTLPHPRMHQRAFVLRPLLEIDASAEIPGLGQAADWLRQCLDQPIERIGSLGEQSSPAAGGTGAPDRIEVTR